MRFFLDFEASSLLPGSFLIEAAWVDAAGHGENYLIRPTDAWLARGTWSPESEAVHGISMDRLLAEGTPADQVAARAAVVMGAQGVTVFSDAPSYDGRWLDSLLCAGGRHEHARLQDVATAYGAACEPLFGSLPEGLAGERATRRAIVRAQEIVAAAEAKERARDRVRHRALPDAEGLWRTWRGVHRRVAAEVARHRTGSTAATVD